MIARLSYDDAEHGEQTATLHEDARWTGDDPTMTRSLNALLSAEDRSPSRGDWLSWHAEKTAKVLDAAIEFEPKEPPPVGMVY